MTERRLRGRTGMVVAVVAGLGTVVAGCGGDSGDRPDTTAGEPTAPASPTPSGMDGMDGGDGMDGMHDMLMNDPAATPANQLRDPIEATFALLDTAPPGSDAVAGTAWIAFGGDPGTTLTVELTGLAPGNEYIGHLHARSCGTDNGGPHFAFDPDGPETPPNEIHIGFVAGEDGTGTATVTNPQAAEAAASVVVHPAAVMDNRLVCADF